MLAGRLLHRRITLSPDSVGSSNSISMHRQDMPPCSHLGIPVKRELDAPLAYPAGFDAHVAAPPSHPSQPRMARMLAHDEARSGPVQALQDGMCAEVPISHPYLLGLRLLQQWHHDSSLALVCVLAGRDVAHQTAVRVVDHQLWPGSAKRAITLAGA